MRFRVSCVDGNPTVTFAAEELASHLRLAGVECDLLVRPGYDPTDQTALWLLVGGDAPAVDDPAFDDSISVSVSDGAGYIAGSNPRSVLLGVYRYLRELGFEWVRPGRDGTVVPSSVEALEKPVSISEKPSYRHRGICIEGTVSLQHVLDLIDWAPKVGFNSYFIQFRDAYTFFERWYRGDGNPNAKPRTFTRKQARDYCRRAVREITRRGLVYHAVGHGWTCEPLGIPGISWEPVDCDLPEDTTRYLAEVDGKRQLWEGIPLNTNLCYSNPEVRRLMVEDVVRYLEAHPEIGVLHFWLADGSNNQCECADCRKSRPSDFYVMMLNELDRAMTEKGLTAKIVFLLYVDLLWPPETEKIENPDRFIRMFAPITRSYSESYSVREELPELPPYTRNRLQFPSSVEENVAFLRAWDKVFDGDGFDFDYHLWLAHYADPSGTWMPRIIHQDIRRLADLGLDGLMSCQVQRCFFPTGLSVYTIGRALWNSETHYEEIERDYYSAAFGPDWQACKAYLDRLGELMDWDYMVGKNPVSEQAAARFEEATELILSFLSASISTVNILGDECRWESWSILRQHAAITVELAQALRFRVLGDPAGARKHWDVVNNMIWNLEPSLHRVLDTLKYWEAMRGYFLN